MAFFNSCLSIFDLDQGKGEDVPGVIRPRDFFEHLLWECRSPHYHAAMDAIGVSKWADGGFGPAGPTWRSLPWERRGEGPGAEGGPEIARQAFESMDAAPENDVGGRPRRSSPESDRQIQSDQGFTCLVTA